MFIFHLTRNTFDADVNKNCLLVCAKWPLEHSPQEALIELLVYKSQYSKRDPINSRQILLIHIHIIQTISRDLKGYFQA